MITIIFCAQAHSPEDAEDGMQFMQEMIDLSQHQQQEGGAILSDLIFVSDHFSGLLVWFVCCCCSFVCLLLLFVCLFVCCCCFCCFVLLLWQYYFDDCLRIVFVLLQVREEKIVFILFFVKIFSASLGYF